MMGQTWEAPSPGDIVWCHFPLHIKSLSGLKPRPALVVQVEEFDAGVDVTVVYGASQKTDRTSSGEFVIRKPEGSSWLVLFAHKHFPGEFDIRNAEHKSAYALSGLSYETRFDLRQQITLPWNENFFAVPPSSNFEQNPKLGALHICLIDDLRIAAKALNK